MKYDHYILLTFGCFGSAILTTTLFESFGEIGYNVLFPMFLFIGGLGWYFLSKWFTKVRRSITVGRVLFVIFIILVILSVLCSVYPLLNKLVQ